MSDNQKENDRERKTVSFSLTKGEYLTFDTEARCRGLTISQYCKTAAFSHLAKYVSKGAIAEIVSLLKGQKEPEMG